MAGNQTVHISTYIYIYISTYLSMRSLYYYADFFSSNEDEYIRLHIFADFRMNIFAYIYLLIFFL